MAIPSPRLACLATALLFVAQLCPAADFHDWAPTPPMGWNSWDCFGTTVTEAITKAQADVMAEKLAPHGYRVVTVDIQWYEDNTGGFDYKPGARVSLDPHGRLVPSQQKFPSAADGTGFTQLADYIHRKGLQLGVHLMRGIPREAVAQNLPILGTNHRAAEIADRVNVCPWNPDMYGVDMSKAGAQEYYNSVFALLASWGVDFVKVDDLSRPYVRNEPEIEAIRHAIDQTGRPMILSLSPGETDIRAAAHVVAHANMWRISDDFWDHWSLLEAQFQRLNAWNSWRRPGAWPDADMIPFGIIELGRKTWFTPAEQKTLMTLWSVARCPLILGADLTKLDAATLGLITNDEVLAVDQHSENNRQLSCDAQGRIVWIAEVPGTHDKYVALFNTRDPWILEGRPPVWQSAWINATTPGRRVEFRVSTEGLHTIVLAADPGSSTRFWWPSLWRGLAWVHPDGSEEKLPHDYGSHGEKISGLTVPPNAIALHGTALLDDAATQPGESGQMRFAIYGFHADELKASGQVIPIKWHDLGFNSAVSVRDLWAHKNLGVMKDPEFSPQIEWHGAGLYRVSPVKR